MICVPASVIYGAPAPANHLCSISSHFWRLSSSQSFVIQLYPNDQLQPIILHHQLYGMLLTLGLVFTRGAPSETPPLLHAADPRVRVHPRGTF